MRRFVYLVFLVICIFCGRGHAETWSTPVDVSESGQNATFPVVEMNDSGQIVAAWLGVGVCKVATLTWEGSWSTPVTLQSGLEEVAYSPNVTINCNGEAVVCWGGEFSVNPQGGVFTATLPFGYGWSSPFSAVMVADNFVSHVYINCNGRVALVSENPISPSEIQATKLDFGGRWSPIAEISDQIVGAKQGQVRVSDCGHIIVVWTETNGSNDVIKAQTSTFEGSWATTYPLYGDTLSVAGYDAENPNLCMEEMGNTVVVWSRSNGTNKIVQSSELRLGGGWSNAVDVSAVGQDAVNADVGLNSSGQIVAVWERSNGTNTIIQAATKMFDGSWSTPVDLSATLQNANNPHVEINDAGQIVVVWERSNGTNTIIQAATLNYGSRWSAPVDLSATLQNANNPEVALNGKGEAIAVWSRSDGTNVRIQSSTTTVAPLPPSSVSGVQKGAISSWGRSYFNVLTWTASLSSNVSQYKIYRDDVLIGTLSASAGTYMFKDWGQPEGVPQNYGISSVCTGGAESAQFTFTAP